MYYDLKGGTLVRDLKNNIPFKSPHLGISGKTKQPI